jgi:hypothetical protein
LLQESREDLASGPLDVEGNLIDSGEFHWIAGRDTVANEGIAVIREQLLSSFGQRATILSCRAGPGPK